MKQISRVIVVLSLALMSLMSVEPSLAQGRLKPFQQDDKWGYKDSRGRVVIQPQYSQAEQFAANGLALVIDDRGYAYIDQKGAIVIRPYLFDNGPDEFSEGLARCVVDNKIGFFNRAGKIVINPSFDFALPFQQGRAAICQGCKAVSDGDHSRMVGGKWGYIDKRGEIVIAVQYDDAGDFDHNRASVTLNGQKIVIDRMGKQFNK